MFSGVKIHFVGIGGIGMSSLARLCLRRGAFVSGSDVLDSGLIARLREEGAEIRIKHKASNVPDGCDLVVYSAAVPESNKELLRARELGMRAISRAEFLGEISRSYKTIAVSGTHGKTTTTAMLAKVMVGAGMDPTAIVGSIVPEWESNFRAGRGRYLVVEACEYRRQFLSLKPWMIVVTNIDADHLDYYKDIADIESAFSEFASRLSNGGKLICRLSDKKVLLRGLPSRHEIKVVEYSRIDAGGLKLKVHGEHNIENAKAVLAAADLLGVVREEAIRHLNVFSGVCRRFEDKGKTAKGALLYDDYAHHPAEIRATLEGAREKFSRNKIIVVFQPHLFSRTKDFLKDFAESFGGADEVVITDIYPARERDDGSVHARDIVEASSHPHISYVPFSDVAEYVKNKSARGDVIITMGAGNVSGTVSLD